MIGRAGKTAFSNSIIGRPFEHTESTIGINELTCEIKYAKVGKGAGWDEYLKQDKEYEAEIARLITKNRKRGSVGVLPHEKVCIRYNTYMLDVTI